MTEYDVIDKQTRFEASITDKDSMTKFRHDDSNKKFEQGCVKN